jgi:short-subunit dehydrogenase
MESNMLMMARQIAKNIKPSIAKMENHKNRMNKLIALSEKTVVIIGASSGIGRATALAFAKEGTTLILVARREGVLQELAFECKRSGARSAVPVRADVTEAESLQQVIEAAMHATGKIDVWINNAGIGAVGDYDKIPLKVHQHVINTSLIGHFNGTYIVLPVFKQQGYGVIINTISVGAWVPEPYAVSYTASKYGLRGFSESLRCELRHWPGIAICDVFPAYIDTPGFQHGANYTGRKLKPVPPVFSPNLVADTMLSLARNPKDSATIGPAKFYRLLNMVSPALFRTILTGVMDNYFKRAKPAPITDGHVFESSHKGIGVSGGWLPVDHGNAKPLVLTALLATFGAVLLARKLF